MIDFHNSTHSAPTTICQGNNSTSGNFMLYICFEFYICASSYVYLYFSFTGRTVAIGQVLKIVD